MTRPRPPDGLVPGGRFATWDPLPPTHAASDVDGTLVGTAASPTPSVLAALAAAEDAGLRVGLATGRGFAAVATVLDRVRLSGPHVLHNGAQVRDDEGVIATVGLDDDAVTRILALVASRDDLDAEVYTDTGYLSARLDPRSQPHWELTGRDPDGRITTVDDLDAPAIKAVLVVFDPTRRDEVVATVRAMGLAAGPAGSPRTPGLVYVNTNRPGVDKGSGLTTLIEHRGLDARAVAVIGDEDNDRSMFLVAGTAIAMGQAPEDVRADAHLVAPTVGEDGAAVALVALTALAQRPPGSW